MRGSFITNYHIDEDTLQHYGVKGMKWGVVKDVAKGGLVGLAAKKHSEKRRASGRMTLGQRHKRAREQYIERTIAQRTKVRNDMNSGSAARGFKRAGLLGVAAVKSERFNKHMNKQWDTADSMDRATLQNIKSGKKSADNIIIGIVTANPIDLALVGRRDRNK